MWWTWLAAFASSEIPVADATSLPEEAQEVSFSDGVLHTELLSTFLEVEDSEGTVVQMVPLVPEGWTASEPVRVWVLCSTTRQSCLDPTTWLEGLQRQPPRGGEIVRRGVGPGSSVALGAEDAKRRHGITSHPDAVVIMAGEPEERRDEQPQPRRVRQSEALLLGGAGLMLSLVLLVPLNLAAMLWGGERYQKALGAWWWAWLASLANLLCVPFVLVTAPVAAVLGACAIWQRPLSVASWLTLLNGVVLPLSVVMQLGGVALVPYIAVKEISLLGEPDSTSFPAASGERVQLWAEVMGSCPTVTRLRYEVELVPEGKQPIHLSCPVGPDRTRRGVHDFPPGGPYHFEYDALLDCSSEIPQDLRGRVEMRGKLVLEGPSAQCTLSRVALRARVW
jgi:hypothetical protein